MKQFFRFDDPSGRTRVLMLAVVIAVSAGIGAGLWLARAQGPDSDSDGMRLQVTRLRAPDQLRIRLDRFRRPHRFISHLPASTQSSPNSARLIEAQGIIGGYRGTPVFPAPDALKVRQGESRELLDRHSACL